MDYLHAILIVLLIISIYFHMQHVKQIKDLTFQIDTITDNLSYQVNKYKLIAANSLIPTIVPSLQQKSTPADAQAKLLRIMNHVRDKYSKTPGVPMSDKDQNDFKSSVNDIINDLNSVV